MDKLLVLLGKRLRILEKLRSRKYYGREIADALGKSPAEISVHLSALEKAGLVSSEGEDGSRRKYYRLSDYGERVLRVLGELPPWNTDETGEKWQVAEIVNVLNDAGLSLDLRKSYSNTFHSVCGEYPVEVLRSEGARLLLEEVVANPFRDAVTRDLMRSVSAVLPYAVRQEKTRRWVREQLYPVFRKIFEGANDGGRVWALRQIGVIAASERSKGSEALRRLVQRWFADDVQPASAFGKALQQQLAELAPRHARTLFEELRARAKDPATEVKAKAEMLLEQLRLHLHPSASTTSGAHGTFA